MVEGGKKKRLGVGLSTEAAFSLFDPASSGSFLGATKIILRIIPLEKIIQCCLGLSTTLLVETSRLWI